MHGLAHGGLNSCTQQQESREEAHSDHITVPEVIAGRLTLRAAESISTQKGSGNHVLRGEQMRKAPAEHKKGTKIQEQCRRHRSISRTILRHPVVRRNLASHLFLIYFSESPQFHLHPLI